MKEFRVQSCESTVQRRESRGWGGTEDYRLKTFSLWSALALALLVSSCTSTGAYPRDFFFEMHYQQSYRAQEPPRLQPAPLAVPVTGREVDPGTFQEAEDLPNPVPLNPENRERARMLFAVNCAFCHGLSGRGDGVVAGMFQAAGAAPPVHFASQRVKARTPGQLYWVLTNGLGNMPPFGKLLTSEERWMLVHFIRSVAGE